MPYSAGPDHGWVRQQRVWGWVLTEDIVLKIVLVSRYWSWHHQSPWKMSQPQGGRTAKDTQQIHTIWQEAILMTRLLGKGHTAERKCCKNLAVCMCEWEGRCVRRGEGGGVTGGLGGGAALALAGAFSSWQSLSREVAGASSSNQPRRPLKAVSPLLPGDSTSIQLQQLGSISTLSVYLMTHDIICRISYHEMYTIIKVQLTSHSAQQTKYDIKDHEADLTWHSPITMNHKISFSQEDIFNRTLKQWGHIWGTWAFWFTSREQMRISCLGLQGSQEVGIVQVPPFAFSLSKLHMAIPIQCSDSIWANCWHWCSWSSNNLNPVARRVGDAILVDGSVVKLL